MEKENEEMIIKEILAQSNWFERMCIIINKRMIIKIYHFVRTKVFNSIL